MAFVNGLDDFKTSKISHHEKYLQTEFQPYADNAGGLVAISGDDYCVVSSDSRLIAGYSIYTRDQPKLFKITDKAVLALAGCWCDCLAFHRNLEIRVKMYRYDHNKELTIQSLAQLVSIMLYNKRFFPYYIAPMVCGIDEQGKGHVYSYDCIGNYENYGYRTEGSMKELVQSFLDNQVGRKNLENQTSEDYKIKLEQALKLTKDSFMSAKERDIQIGDSAHIFIITKDGIKEEKFELRKD